MAYKALILPGDGIGKEVVAQATRMLEQAAKLVGYNIEFDTVEAGGEYFYKHGVEYPAGTIEKAKAVDIIIKGPVGTIDPETKQEIRRPDGFLAGYGLVIGLRKELELFAIVRPALAYEGIPFMVFDTDIRDIRQYPGIYTPKNLDLVIVREGTEGEYQEEFEVYPHGEKDFRKIDKVVSPIIVTRKATERIADFSFNLAMKRRKKLVCLDKGNAIKAHEYFGSVVKEVSKRYPKVEFMHEYADNFADLVLSHPNRYDVAVTTNLIGDILSDEAAALQGGRGIAPSICIGYDHIMVEAIHGTAPDIAGKDIANPFAMGLSAKMGLEWLGDRKNDERLKKAARLIEDSIKQVLMGGEYRTVDIGGKTEKTLTGLKIDPTARCSVVGDALLSMMKELY